MYVYRESFEGENFRESTSMKISWRKLSRILAIDRILVARARDVREENFRERAEIREIRENFLPRKFHAIRYVDGMI